MDEPPSFTSVMARNTDQQQPQVTEPNHFDQEVDEYNPSMSKIRFTDDQPRSNPSFGAGTAARATVQPTETYDDVEAVSIGAMALGGRGIQLPDQLTDTSYNNDPALSIGFMVGDRGNNSQPVGGKFSYDAAAPPSLTDVARRDESQTGESSGGQNLPEGNYEEMSITGRDFERLHPIMSLKEDGHNPSPF